MFEEQVKDQPHSLLLEDLMHVDDKAQIEAVFEQSSPAEITRMISGPRAKHTRIMISSMHMWCPMKAG